MASKKITLVNLKIASTLLCANVSEVVADSDILLYPPQSLRGEYSDPYICPFVRSFVRSPVRPHL